MSQKPAQRPTRTAPLTKSSARKKYCFLNTRGKRGASGSSSATPSETPVSSNSSSFRVLAEHQARISQTRTSKIKTRGEKTPKLKEFRNGSFKTKSMKKGSYKRSKGWFSDFLDWCLDRFGGCFGCEFEKNKANPRQQQQSLHQQSQDIIQTQQPSPASPMKPSPFLTQELAA